MRLTLLAVPASLLVVAAMAAPAQAVVTVSGSTVSSDGAGDFMSISCVGNVLASTGTGTTGNNCATLTQISVNPGAGADTIEMGGVTAADFCLADTATIVLRNRPGQPRTVALVPSIHVAVVTLDQLITDMKELFALLQWDEGLRQEGLTRYMSFISGPSKTGDIEAIMVHGAHGPKEVRLYVVTG